ncbi:MAG: FkbM family methyltransferase [Lishizhenia sp.]
MKNTLKYILQKLFGFRTYLYIFSQFKIKTLKRDKKEGHFFHFLDLLEDGKGDILDVGANIGIMSHHLAERYPNDTIHAFEPMPDNLAVLRKVLKKNKLTNVSVYDFAVGDSEGSVKMILPENGKTKEQGLSHIKHDSITEWNDGIEFEVNCKLLDTVLEGKTIQGIKMDVENFEYYALKGAINILKNQKPLIYTELWDNENRKKCFELLKELDYSIFVVQKRNLVPFNRKIHNQQNFIFK